MRERVRVCEETLEISIDCDWVVRQSRNSLAGKVMRFPSLIQPFRSLSTHHDHVCLTLSNAAPTHDSAKLFKLSSVPGTLASSPLDSLIIVPVLSDPLHFAILHFLHAT